MLCPRCRQSNSVEEQDTDWFCHACSVHFNENTQVIRPITKDSIWVEFRGAGSLVRIVDVLGDTFNPSTPIRYQLESFPDTPPSVMLAEDFRYYFRPKKNSKPQKAVSPPCKVGEEWESDQGIVYAILEVSKAGDVFLVPIDADHQSFWVKGQDFLRLFRQFIRPTDFNRLLDE